MVNRITTIVPTCFEHRNAFIGYSSAIGHFLATELALEACDVEAIHIFLSDHETDARCKFMTRNSIRIDRYVDVDQLMQLDALECRLRILETTLDSLRLASETFKYGWDSSLMRDAYLFAVLMGDTYRTFLLPEIPNSRGEYFGLPMCEWNSDRLSVYACIFKSELGLVRRVHLFSAMAGNTMAIMGMSQKWKNSKTYSVRGGVHKKWSAEVDVDADSPVRLVASLGDSSLLE